MKTNLVGDLRCGQQLTEEKVNEFLKSLENLMDKFDIDKVDVGWKRRHIIYTIEGDKIKI